MTNRTPVDRAEVGSDAQNSRRHGPGRWLLTWAGVFTMVIVLAVIFAITIIVFAT